MSLSCRVASRRVGDLRFSSTLICLRTVFAFTRRRELLPFSLPDSFVQDPSGPAPFLRIRVEYQSAIHLAKNATYHSRTKHIQRMYHWLREGVEEKEFSMMKIHTAENGSDMLTKVLSADKLNVCLQRVWLMKQPMPKWRWSLMGNMSLRIGKKISNLVDWLTQPRPIPKSKLRLRINFVTNSRGYKYK